MGTVLPPVELPSININRASEVSVNAGELNRRQYGPHSSLVPNVICQPLILLLILIEYVKANEVSTLKTTVPPSYLTITPFLKESTV